ncbi:MAG: AraC family transcriptional regulator [Bacillota bacterium]|nr:AraC family transcriptional regulator [Bacillota bacterium]
MKHLNFSDFEFFHYKDEVVRNFEFKNHDVFEIFFLLSGHVTYLIEGRSYRLSPGDILLINNNELHKPVLTSGEAYERIIVWIKPDFLNKHSIKDCDLSYCFHHALINVQNLIRLNVSDRKKIQNAVFLLEDACESAEFGNHILRNSYMMEIIVHINRYFLQSSKSENINHAEFNDKISRLVDYINQNLAENLSLDQLSEKFYLSKYHLLHEFKKYTGYSIHQYILQKRLISAKKLLKEGMSVNEVCEASGFNDYSNFIRTFKNNYGVSPKRYSKNYDIS